MTNSMADKLIVTPIGRRIINFVSTYYHDTNADELVKDLDTLYKSIDRFCRSKKARTEFLRRSNGTGLKDFVKKWADDRKLYEKSTQSLLNNHNSREVLEPGEIVERYRCIIEDEEVNTWFTSLSPRQRGAYIKEIHHKYEERDS